MAIIRGRRHAEFIAKYLGTVLNGAVNEILALPSIQNQMIRQGADPVGGGAEEFGQFVRREYEKWKVIVHESRATPE